MGLDKMKIKQKNKIALIILIVLTQFGSSILGYLLSLNVLMTSSSAIEFSKVILAGSLTSLIASPLIGIMVDKYNKKLLLFIAQVISIIVLALFFWNSFLNKNLSVTWIILLIIVLNLTDTLVSTTLMSSAVYMVDSEEELGQFNGWQQTIDSSCSLLGPIIAGIIYPFVSITQAIGFEVLCESLAIIAILYLKFNSTSVVNQEFEEEFSDFNMESTSLVDSIKYLLKKKILLFLFVGMLMMNLLLSSITIGYPTIVINYFPDNSIAVGFLNASIPLGMIISGLYFAHKQLDNDNLNIVIKSWYTCGISLIAISLSILILHFSVSLMVIMLILISLVLGLALTAGKVPILVYFQKHVVPQQQGRIFSILDIVVQISIPLGTVVYGILFDYFSFVSTFLISGVLIIIFVIMIQKTILRDEQLKWEDEGSENYFTSQQSNRPK